MKSSLLPIIPNVSSVKIIKTRRLSIAAKSMKPFTVSTVLINTEAMMILSWQMFVNKFSQM